MPLEITIPALSKHNLPSSSAEWLGREKFLPNE
jgi:hypothetical protein